MPNIAKRFPACPSVHRGGVRHSHSSRGEDLRADPPGENRQPEVIPHAPCTWWVHYLVYPLRIHASQPITQPPSFSLFPLFSERRGRQGRAPVPWHPQRPPKAKRPPQPSEELRDLDIYLLLQVEKKL